MSVNADAARCRPSLGVGILIAEGGISPRPACAYHQRLEVVLAGKAHCYGTVIPVIIVDLVTRHRATGDELDESLCRQGTWIPMAIIARLPFLRSVDAEQTDELLAKFHGIAI